MLNVDIKKLHKDAVVPTYAKEGDAGMDLTSVSEPNIVKVHNHYCYVEYDTGLSFEIPEGYVGYLFPRSSVSKKSLNLANSVGVVDSNYRGSVKLRFRLDMSALELPTLSNNKPFYVKGDRVGQIIIMPYPKVKFNEVNELTETDRGTGGFGSTGE